MRKPKPDPALRDIDAKTEELMRQFFNFVRQYQAKYPGEIDPRIVFESWAIQKIAGLQYTVLHLAEKLNELTTLMRGK